MFFGKKDKYRDKKVDLLYNVLSKHSKDFSESEIKAAILEEGYDDKIAKLVINKFKKEKVQFKKANSKKTANDSQKQKLLQEINKSITDVKPIKSKSKPVKETKPKTKGTNPFKKIGLGFKKFYFSLEDKYYNMVDAINKVIPINGLVDSIDKVMPSFIIFLIVLCGIIFALVNFGINGLGVSSFTLNLEVTDELSNPLKGSNVLLQIDGIDQFEDSTDVFGEITFNDIKAKGVINLIVTKDHYDTLEKAIDVTDKVMFEKVKLSISTTQGLFAGTEEQTRELTFLNNDALAVGKTLNTTLYCSNNKITPEPNKAKVVNGRLSVLQPVNCGDLRIDVVSTYFKDITNTIVPQNNKIQLEKLNNNTGELQVTVKDISGQPIRDAAIKTFLIDDPTTSVDESNQQVSLGLSDYYGKYVFDLNPANYLIIVDKPGYLTTPKYGPNNVIKNNTTVVDYILFTVEDLQNIDCSNPIYDQFCINGQIDYTNPLLQDYLVQDENGEWIIGEIGFIDVTLKDQSSNALVEGDISVYKKTEGSDENTFVYQLLSTRGDVSHTVFNVLKNNNYQIRVSNTESNGYIIPEPLNITSLDTNETIYLEYSSELNSGIVGVNVQKNNYDISNAAVYLYYGDGDLEDSLVTPDPCYTDMSGDCNFTSIRSGKEYYAYAVSMYEQAQGESSTEELDANEFLELDVDLEAQSKILNLKTNTSDYNITFYNPSGDVLTNYVSNPIEGYDLNKEYIFNGNDTRVYAVISADSYASYQTDIVDLINGQVVYREVSLDPNLTTSANAEIEFLGLYDETGSLNIDEISFASGDLEREYKLKFRFNNSLGSEEDLTYAHIRAGEYLSLDSDYIYLTDIFAPNTDRTYGCIFSGELEDWNIDYFSANYNNDHQQTNCDDDGFKWVDIDFVDSLADTIEFSVNFKFRNGITSTDKYKLHYRALTQIGNDFSFDPSVSNWQNWTVKPEGYFYNETKGINLPFISDDYAISSSIVDDSGEELEVLGTDKIMLIDDIYTYNLDFIYLNENILENRSTIFSSENTNDHLSYSNFNFLQTYYDDVQLNDSYPEVTVDTPQIEIGYSFNSNTNVIADGFFEVNNDSAITTNVFDIDDYLSPFEINVLSYAQEDGFVEIQTNDSTGENNIYIGNNTVDFIVRNQQGAFIDDIEVCYLLQGSSEQCLGSTTNGTLEAQTVTVPLAEVGSNITFIFKFPAEYGFANNQIEVIKPIASGYSVYNSQTNAVINLDNPLEYSVFIMNINGEIVADKFTKDYYIKKHTTYDPNLQEILFSSLDLEYFNADDIYSNLTTDNYLSRYLYEEDTTMKSNVLLENSIDSSVNNADALYLNLLKIGEDASGDIILVLDVPTIVDIDYVLLDLDEPDSSQGVVVDDLTTIELIEDASTSMTLNYVLTNTSLTPLVIDSISANIGSNLNNRIELDYTYSNSSTGTTNNNGGSNFNPIEDDDTLYFDGGNTPGYGNSEPEEQSEESESGDEVQEPIVEDITFTIDLSLINNVVTTQDTIDVIVHLKDSQTNMIVDYIIPIDVKTYKLEDAYTLTPIFGQNINIISTEENNGGSVDKYYRVVNNTDSYELVVDSYTFDTTGDVTSEVLTQLPVTFNDQLDLTVNYNVVYNENNFGYSDGNSTFIVGINNQNIIDTTDLDFAVTIPIDPIETVLDDYGLTADLCLGVGGNLENGNFNILANCEETTDDCRTGVGNLPKVNYYWGPGSLQQGVDWSNACINNSAEYDEPQMYCDSVQMLLTVFSTLTGDYNETNDYYLYLMSDGVSPDLLVDFINYTNEFGFTIDQDLRENSSLMNVSKVASHEFTIAKKDVMDNDVIKTGKYKLEINSDFTTEEESELHITLRLMQEIPASDMTLFYYLPVDGKVGLTTNQSGTYVHRAGYGAVSDYATLAENETILVTPEAENFSDAKLYSGSATPCSNGCGSARVTARNYNELFGEDLRKTLRSQGKLISINLDGFENNNAYLDFKYMPSYPVPLYAKVGAQDETSAFVYNLKNNDNLLDIDFDNVLRWSDHSQDNKILKDKTYYIEGSENYAKSIVDATEFNRLYNSNIKRLLKTNIYLPMGSGYNVNNLSLVLDNSGTIINSNATKLYGLNNLEGNDVEIALDSRVSDVLVQNITDVFELVRNEKACIYNGLASTYIKWIETETEFEEDSVNTIINNSEIEEGSNDGDAGTGSSA